jgi:chromosome segregation ATPase
LFCAFAQEDLLRSRKQWQEHRERLATSEGELGHLSAIRDRSENLQAEMKTALTRLSAAEAESRRLRSEVERWRSLAGEAEDRAAALAASLRESERHSGEHKRAVQELQAELTTVSGQLQTAQSAQVLLAEEKERARSVIELREQALAAERSKSQEMEFKLRSVEHKSDSEKQRGSVKEEELSRTKVPAFSAPMLMECHTTPRNTWNLLKVVEHPSHKCLTRAV